MACGTEVITIKTGSDANFSVEYTEDSGLPVDLTYYVINMDFLDPKTGETIKETSTGNGITITDAKNGLYTIRAGNTLNWPVGEMPVDIKYTSNSPDGVITEHTSSQHTDTFILDIVEGLSQ